MSSAFAASANTKQIATSRAPPLSIFFMRISYRQFPQFEAPSTRQTFVLYLGTFSAIPHMSDQPTALCILENST